MKVYSTEELTQKELKKIAKEKHRQRIDHKKRAYSYSSDYRLSEYLTENWLETERRISSFLTESNSLKSMLIKNGLAKNGIFIEFGHTKPVLRSLAFYFQLVIRFENENTVEMRIYKVSPKNDPLYFFIYKKHGQHPASHPRSLPIEIKTEVIEILKELQDPKIGIPLLLRKFKAF